MPNKYHQVQQEMNAVKSIEAKPIEVPIPFVPSTLTPEIFEAVKEKLQQMKSDEQKKKKRDYQREYMRNYKKDVPLSETDLAKKKLKRTLKKYDPNLVKEVLGDLE